MHSLNNVLKKFIKDLGLESSVALYNLRNQWANIVGQTIAAHTHPDMIKGKILTIVVDTPQWLHHLSFYKEEITTKLGPYNVKEIRFKLSRLPEKDHSINETDNSMLTEDDLRYLENTLRNIRDKELKEKFRELLIHGLKRGRSKI